MKKGRDTFIFQLKEPDKAQTLINEWLQVYQFAAFNLKGEPCYRRGDTLVGYAYFNYQMQGTTLTIWTWQHDIAGDVSIYGANIFNGTYRDIVNQLLEKISNISLNHNQAPATVPAQNGANMNSQNNNYPQSSNSSNFRNLSNKTDERLCLVGFIMSLANLVLVLLDGSVALGGLGYIILFVCASRGLKTKKRNLAIAAMVLGGVSLVILVIKVISTLY